MSGHSKWSTIKHKKGAADKARGKLFSKLARAIIVAAKEGGPDPDGNAALATAVEKARGASMPKDNIERAIARGAGSEANSDAYEAVTYEGYGVGGAAVIVEALTDNRNRTAADVRYIFGKYAGSLGTPGSVAWMFERRGLITLPLAAGDEDTVTLAAAEGGAEDVRAESDHWQITCEPGEIRAVQSALAEAGLPVAAADLVMLPTTQVEVEVDQARTLVKLVDALEENDDVQDVWFNFDIPEAVLAEL